MHHANWNGFANVIFEGNLYEITNFVVRQATGALKPVSSTTCIVLTQSTIAEQILNDAITPIPMHKFELVELEELYDIVKSYPLDEIPANAIGDCKFFCLTIY